MTTLEFLSHLRGLDVRLWADGDRLRYSVPEGVLTPSLRAELAERKEEILEFLREAGAAAGLNPPPISPVSHNEPMPLSFAQRRLWFLDQLEPGSSAYNIPTAVHLAGHLDAIALERSLNEIMRRHEALRTTFAMANGQPVQLIDVWADGKWQMPVINLQRLPKAEREAEAQRLAVEEARRPFDLAQGPLLRVVLLQLSESEHILLMTMHHIVSDAWSLDVFFRELGVLYDAYTTGVPSPLPELPIHYADFAVWEREWLQGRVLETQLAYWRKRLAGDLPVLQLPADRPRPSTPTFRGGFHTFVLPKPLIEALRSLSQQEGTTLFMTLLAAFDVLLHRYTGEEDIVVGSPVTNRNRPELEGLIGFFVNTLVLRTDLSGNPTFRESLARVRQVSLGAYAHQILPFDYLVEELHPQRGLGRQPLFQVMFAAQNASMPKLELAGLTLTPLEVDTGTAQFDLAIELWDVPEGLKGYLEYDKDLFDAATIARMAGHFQTLLEGVVADPEQHLSSLPVLTGAEERQLLVEWVDTGAEWSRGRCVHELFEAQAARTPEAVAVEEPFGEALSYGELNRRANQLGRYLRGLGVRPEGMVGLCVERSVEMVVGVLGILKAGGAYVPLGPRLPEERLRLMVEDTGAGVVVTQGGVAGRLPGGAVRVVRLDADWGEIGRGSGEDLVGEARPENVACVIYTSGSTGRPKGVMVEHRSLVSFVEAAGRMYELGPRDRVLQFASLSFDAAGEEIYPCLARGGTLVLRTEEMIARPGVFWEACGEWGLTVLDLPTAYWHELAGSLREGMGLPEGLRLVIIGGERAQAGQLRRWWGQVGEGVRLVNTYGPTEGTVVATACELGEEEAGGREVPIGRAIENVRVYILDRYLEPVPVGVVGELHIGGNGVARGYLNDPGLTGEKFVPDPFGGEGGGRLYRTGDLARYVGDGQIEFMGRLDDQVKVRGYRVEPGEVEVVLSGHGGVRGAAVVVRDDGAGGKRLVGYVVVEEGVTGQELRQYLAGKLPGYMVPGVIVVVEELPLTASGKVDRGRLPEAAGRAGVREGYEGPRDAVEEVLVEMWGEVLGVEGVGVHDDFFELGGHSLLATRLISRVRETFHVELPLRDFFRTATVAGLARAIDSVLRVGPSTAVTSLDLGAEAALDSSIRPEALPREEISEPTSIFLTGATGFLGAFLLRELLQQTQADIYCLVRAADTQEAASRIQATFGSYLLPRQQLSSRVVPVVGDLSQPRFGLSSQEFHELAGKIDAIYHSGALVNLVYPYQQLKSTNVLGTQEVLRLAAQAKRIPVHHISTISVFESPSYLNRDRRVILEHEIPSDGGSLLSGYAQSKWVAEKLVVEARSRGLPVYIYRPGEIGGDSHTGAWNTDDYICRFIKGCIQLGGMPNLDEMLYPAPVDCVSKAIVHLSRLPALEGQVFHVLSPHSLHVSQLADLIRSFGYSLQLISYDRWLTKLIKVAGCSSENALYSLLPFFIGRVPSDEGLTIPEMYTQDREPRFDCRNFVDGLNGTDIVCPPVDAELFATYMSYFIRSGFLAPPSLAEGIECPVEEEEIEVVSSAIR